jgi:hypothetical protein
MNGIKFAGLGTGRQSMYEALRNPLQEKKKRFNGSGENEK